MEKYSFTKHLQQLIAFEHFQHRRTESNGFSLFGKVGTVGFGKGKGRVRQTNSPGEIQMCFFKSLNHSCRICLHARPPCVLWCLWYHRAHGTAVPTVPLCHLSSWPRAAMQIDVEGAVATEYPKNCEPRAKVAPGELFSFSILTVF